jgi:hypothetical protein
LDQEKKKKLKTAHEEQDQRAEKPKAQARASEVGSAASRSRGYFPAWIVGICLIWVVVRFGLKMLY